MSRLVMRQAEQGNSAALAALSAAAPMGGVIRLSFERDPDFFAASRVQTTHPEIIAGFAPNGRALGMFSAGIAPIHAGTEQLDMRYLSDLRIDPSIRQGVWLARGFRHLREHVFRPGEWARTLILEENREALRLLTSGRAGLPVYHPAGRYVSLMLTAPVKSSNSRLRIRLATAADLPLMEQLRREEAAKRWGTSACGLTGLGSEPSWQGLHLEDIHIAEDDQGLAGFAGLWDQQAFRRIRIDGYSRSLGAIRPLVNLGARLFSRPALPPVGKILPVVHLGPMACRDSDPRILRALLEFVTRREVLKGRILLAGFGLTDPLLSAFGGIPARRDYGRHFLVGFDGSSPALPDLPLAFEVGRI